MKIIRVSLFLLIFFFLQSIRSKGFSVMAQTPLRKDFRQNELLIEGIQLIEERRFSEALQSLEEALLFSLNYSNPEEEAQVRVLLCDAYRRVNRQFEEANQQCQAAISIYQDLNKQNLLAETLVKLAFYSWDRPEVALRHFDQAILIYRDSMNYDKEAETIIKASGLTQSGSRAREEKFRASASLYLERLQALIPLVTDLEIKVKALQELVSLQIAFHQFEEAERAHEAIIFIYKRENLLDKEFDAIWQLGKFYQSIGKYDQAFDSYYTAVSVVDWKDKLSKKAEVFLEIGSLYSFYFGGLNKKVIPYQEAVKIYLSLENYTSAAEVSCSIGRLYFDAREYEKAIDYYLQSIEFWKQTDNQYQDSCAIKPLGDISLLLGEFQHSIEYYQTLETNISVRAIANTFQEMKDYDGVISQYREAIDNLLLENPISDVNIQEIYSLISELAQFYIEIEQYKIALSEYERLLSFAKTKNDIDKQVKVLLEIANLYQILESPNKSEESYHLALDLLNDSEQLQTIRNIYRELSKLYRDLGNIEKATEQYLEIINLFRQEGDLLSEISELRKLSAFYIENNQYNEADKIIDYLESKSLNEKLEVRKRSLFLYELGEAHFNRRNFKEAADIFKQVIDICLNDIVPNVASYASILDCTLESQYKLALSLWHLGELETTISNLFVVIEQIEETNMGDFYFPEFIGHGDILLNESLSHYLDERKYNSIYSILQQALVSDGRIEEALVVSEKSRARGLILELKDSLLRQKIVKNLDYWSTESFHREIFQHQLMDADLGFDSIRDFAIANNTTLVAYSLIEPTLSDRALYIWVIEPSGEMRFKQIDTSEFLLMESILENRADTELGRIPFTGIDVVFKESLHSQYKQSLRDLYSILIQPIEDFLPASPQDNVLFLPQREIFLVPFAALINAEDKYLVENHSINLAHSVQSLLLFNAIHNNDKRERGENLLTQENLNNFLLVGNPEPMPFITLPSSEPVRLNRLSGTEREVADIAKIFGVEPLIGEDAKEFEVIEAMKTASIIHLASHGVSDIGLTGYFDSGAIALAPDPNAPLAYQWNPLEGRQDDGWLTAEEINDMTLNAQLVVLSACNTGVGDITQDGILSLPRAFMQAGVPNVIASLWEVPDESTAFLMQQFYSYLHNGIDTSRSLRLSMLDTMKIYPEPANWAAFTLLGSGF